MFEGILLGNIRGKRPVSEMSGFPSIPTMHSIQFINIFSKSLPLWLTGTYTTDTDMGQPSDKLNGKQT